VERTDDELIGHVLRGDRESFHALVRRHSPALWSTISRRLARRPDAEEVLQETWLAAWEHLAELRTPGRLRSWLVSIAYNRLRQRSRRAAPETTHELDEITASDESGLARDLAGRELVRRVRAAVARLPARQREVLDLRVNHGMEHAEVARVLEISAESSRANLYQALKRLRAELGSLWTGDEA
jgi:RNA polymerase sigma-70 factor (ECF subfamily)